MGKLRRPGSHTSRPRAGHRRSQRPGRAPRSTVGTLTELRFPGLSTRGWARRRRIRPLPLLFSFNSPEGACPACRGLGVEDRIDPELLVGDPSKTLREGALVLTTPNGYIIYSQVTMEVLDRVCRAHGFSVDVPWRELTGEQRDVVLNGSRTVLVPFGKHPLESRLRWTGSGPAARELYKDSAGDGRDTPAEAEQEYPPLRADPALPRAREALRPEPSRSSFAGWTSPGSAPSRSGASPVSFAVDFETRARRRRIRPRGGP
jgi:hypothetical protein